MWFRHEGYKDFVQQSWDGGPGGGDLLAVNASLLSMKEALKDWERNVFGSVKNKMKDTRNSIEKERQRTLYRGPTARERELVGQLAELQAREGTMEKQRSRVSWLKEGDRNTRFFQAKARARGRTNRIRALRREDGTEVTDQEELEQMASTFYQNLFQAQDNLDPALVCNHIPRKVTDQMNVLLDNPFTQEEVEAALFKMNPSKAPGIDGFNAGFFQRHWHVLKERVTAAILGFLNGGEMPEEINRTLLVLIPKVANPQELTQFRPISLCNVLYKICSKTMANRLRVILDEIIAEEQSAFVPGWLITDNVLIAYECIHYLKNKKGKLGACAIKLDMAKAYDRVEWQYLDTVMAALGFSNRWRDLVIKCVTSVSFSVRVNGQLSPVFKPSRGLRQGDPISPYLFLLCAEGLSCMLKEVGPVYCARGIRVGIHAPWINHLLFADDCMIFTQATRRGAERVADILDKYHRGSGQLVNKHKSAIFFSANCEDGDKEIVCNSLDITVEALGKDIWVYPHR
jgi:hypothetical protein